MRLGPLAALVAAAAAMGQELPEGSGKAESEKLCKGCHEMARSISKKQDRDGWMATMTKIKISPFAKLLNLKCPHLHKSYKCQATRIPKTSVFS